MYVGDYTYTYSPTLHFDISCNNRSIGCQHILAPSISYCISIIWPYVYSFNFLRSVYKRLYIFSLGDKQRQKAIQKQASDAIWCLTVRLGFVTLEYTAIAYNTKTLSTRFLFLESPQEGTKCCGVKNSTRFFTQFRLLEQKKQRNI